MVHFADRRLRFAPRREVDKAKPSTVPAHAVANHLRPEQEATAHLRTQQSSEPLKQPEQVLVSIRGGNVVYKEIRLGRIADTVRTLSCGAGDLPGIGSVEEARWIDRETTDVGSAGNHLLWMRVISYHDSHRGG